jgi:hypothetical protein
MPIALGLAFIFVVFLLYQLFINGWLFKIILFFAGWFGLHIWISQYIEGGNNVAVSLGSNGDIPISWAVLLPTLICALALLCTKVD